MFQLEDENRLDNEHETTKQFETIFPPATLEPQEKNE